MLIPILTLLAAEQPVPESSEGIDLLFPDPSELIAGIIAFTIIFVFVWKWVLPTLQDIIEKRQQAIKAEQAAAEAAKIEAESLLADYRTQLAGARDEASRIVEDARQAGEAVKGDVVARAQSEADAIKQRAVAEAATERDRLAVQLRREVAALSLDVAEKVVGSSLDEEAQRALVERYIDELGGAKA